jgi:hypothetical protein
MSVAVRVFAIPTFGVHYALVHAGYRIFLVAWVGGGGGAMRPVVSTCDACSPARMLHSVHGWVVHGVVDGVTHTLSIWMHPHMAGIMPWSMCRCHAGCVRRTVHTCSR